MKDATTSKRAEAKRRNTQRSTGPTSTRGKSSVRFNAIKHGLRAKTLVLPGEDPQALRARHESWTASLQPQDDLERYLVDKALKISWQLDRAERALTAREALAPHDALERSFQEADDVVMLGHRLLYDPRGPMALYPHGQISFRDPWWISWSRDINDENQPAVVLNLLESSALGCAWLLDRWGELREVLEEGLNWQGPDRFKAIRLLGRQPLDALDDGRVMAIYRGCAAMDPRGPHPIEDVHSEMSEDDWQWYRKRVEDREATAKRLEEPDEGLAVLLDLIAGEEERLEGVLAAHLAREEAALAEGPGFEDSKDFERLRRYQLTYNRMLLRILETLRKRRREAAREGAAGSSRLRVAAPAPDVTNEAIYESWEVKRAGADSVSREPPHIPLAGGVGRSGPSQTPPTSRVVHPRHTSPEPEAEGGVLPRPFLPRARWPT
jgi:hypothetical protein